MNATKTEAFSFFINQIVKIGDQGDVEYGDAYKSLYKLHPDLPLGQVVEKMSRYKNTHNETDIFKAVVLLFLYWDVHHYMRNKEAGLSSHDKEIDEHVVLGQGFISLHPKEDFPVQCTRGCKGVFHDTDTLMHHHCEGPMVTKK
jgi:hypothetical protein